MEQQTKEEIEQQYEELELKKKQLYIEEENEKIRRKEISSSVSDTAIWILIIVLSIMTFIEAGGYTIHFLFYLFVNSGLIVMDSAILKKHDISHPSLGWIVLVPVYIWKRNKMLYKSQYTFWFYLVAPFVAAALNIS
jgi:hypothetical protein